MQKECSDHNNEFIALCKTCKKGLCIDCLFDHQSFPGHTYEKLSKLKEKWVTKLQDFNQFKKQNTSSKSGEKNSKENFQTLKQLKSKILDIVEAHFNELKENLSLICPNESSKEGNSIETTINSLKNAGNNSSIMQIVKKLEDEDHKYDTSNNKNKDDYPIRVHLNEIQLSKFTDSLKRTVCLSYSDSDVIKALSADKEDFHHVNYNI